MARGAHCIQILAPLCLFCVVIAGVVGSLTHSEVSFVHQLPADEIFELGRLVGMDADSEGSLVAEDVEAFLAAATQEELDLVREAIHELGYTADLCASTVQGQSATWSSEENRQEHFSHGFTVPTHATRTFEFLRNFSQYGRCVQAWDPYANFTSGKTVAIPPHPRSHKQAHAFGCTPTSPDGKRAVCGFSGEESDWTYDPLREGQHQLTFYPYENAQHFRFAGAGLQSGEIGTPGWFSAAVVGRSCAPHWVLKARLVGPAIVLVQCKRVGGQCEWRCEYKAADAGAYRVEVVLHQHGDRALPVDKDLKQNGQHCHSRAAIKQRVWESCEGGDEWARRPLFAAEYLLNRSSLLISVASSPPPPPPPTPLCPRANHAGRWLRLASPAHAAALNGSAFSGSNLDFVLDEVGLNRGWIWAPYDCHYHLYTPQEFEACVGEEYSGIVIEAEGDSLIREVLEGLVQLLRIGDLTNGQKIKPRRRFEIDRRLRWDWLEAAAPSDAFLAGPSAVLTPYRAGGFAGLDASLSEHVTAVIAACQWDARACGYVFPAALHTHVFGGWRAFADRLERRLRDDGVWDHVIDTRATTEARWDASFDGVHYLWSVAVMGPVYEKLLEQSTDPALDFVYESRRHEQREKRRCCSGGNEEARRHRVVEYIADLRAEQSGCVMWQGGVGRTNGMLAANYLCNAWLERQL